MIANGSKRGTMRFVFMPPNGAKQVHVAGNFSDWRPLAMKKQKGGRFAVTVPLAPGTYEYRFVVDGEWMPDPDCDGCTPNPFGGVNSVAQVQ